MAIGAPDERRGCVVDDGLVERAAELRAIDELLDASADGADHGLLIVGQAGLGKTRLYRAAVDRAHARGFLVLGAAGSELEQSVAFGVAGRLFGTLLGAFDDHGRADLLKDAPERVRALAAGEPALSPVAAEDGLAVAHGLFALLAAATETRPALLALDDLQWCDASSLGFLLYVLNRLGEVSLGLLLTSRARDPEGDELDSITVHPASRVHTLAPLGRDAVRELVVRGLGADQPDTVTDVCLRATGGNPFYLHELLQELAESPGAPGEQLAQLAGTAAPDTVARSVRVRVHRRGADATALARAVAVLGDDTPLRRAAALAKLDAIRASNAARELAAADILLKSEPLRFAHPLIRTAVEHNIPAFERAGRHLEAARLLASEGESAERIAAHLLRGRPAGDRWAVQQLRAASALARSQGANRSAVRYLERALDEPPPEELRGSLLLELGTVEAALGLAVADEHLALAARTADPREQAEIALVRGEALYAQSRFEEASDAYQVGLDELAGVPADEGARRLLDRLQTGWLVSAATVPRLQAEARRLSAQALEQGPSALPTSRRRLLAQAVVEATYGGGPAEVVVDLATRAWEQGRLLDDETASGASWLIVTVGLCLAGELERSIEIAEAAAADAGRRSAPLAFATATYMRALPQLWQGNVDGALADLELARGARRYGWRQFARSAAAQYCLCMIEKGELENLDAALVEDAPLAPPFDAEGGVRLHALAELRRAQGRHAEAYEAAVAAGEAVEVGISYLGYCPWRCSAVQSALALGRRDRAGELLEQEFERLAHTQVPHERIRALRLAGLYHGGEEGLAKLRAAVELGEAHPPRIETIHALLALGSALRRSGQRAAARPPLRRALDLARRGGAAALQHAARTELAASGARLRREAMSGPESLTASERRVADLAVAGQSNRQIAATLFITPKTVEYHLRNCYRKLEIQTRLELTHALADS